MTNQAVLSALRPGQRIRITMTRDSALRVGDVVDVTETDGTGTTGLVRLGINNRSILVVREHFDFELVKDIEPPIMTNVLLESLRLFAEQDMIEHKVTFGHGDFGDRCRACWAIGYPEAAFFNHTDACLWVQAREFFGIA